MGKVRQTRAFLPVPAIVRATTVANSMPKRLPRKHSIGLVRKTLEVFSVHVHIMHQVNCTFDHNSILARGTCLRRHSCQTRGRSTIRTPRKPIRILRQHMCVLRAEKIEDTVLGLSFCGVGMK